MLHTHRQRSNKSRSVAVGSRHQTATRGWQQPAVSSDGSIFRIWQMLQQRSRRCLSFRFTARGCVAAASAPMQGGLRLPAGEVQALVGQPIVFLPAAPTCKLKPHGFFSSKLTFFLSLIEPFPRIIILHPVSCSNCFAVIPRGPRIRPTKLN